MENDLLNKKSITLGMKLIKGLAADMQANLKIENTIGFAVNIDFEYDQSRIALLDIESRTTA